VISASSLSLNSALSLNVLAMNLCLPPVSLGFSFSMTSTPLCVPPRTGLAKASGFNRAGNPIEVFYNPIGDDAIKVFHAMGCRDDIITQIEP
jgi:hypothetical protein